MSCGDAAVKWLCNPAAQVSSHYLIDTDGRIIQMVREKDRAWHAGVSYWAGETDINSCSIGIEIQNEGHALDVLPPFPELQMQAVEALCLDIIQRHNIPAHRVLGHSDVAIGRKVDPGEAFDWERLCTVGVGLWVKPDPSEQVASEDKYSLAAGDAGDRVLLLQSQLKQLGYGIDITGHYDDVTTATVTAFQRHWRQSCVNGIADMSTLQSLNKLCCSLPKL